MFSPVCIQQLDDSACTIRQSVMSVVLYVVGTRDEAKRALDQSLVFVGGGVRTQDPYP